MTIAFAGIGLEPPSDADRIIQQYWAGHRIVDFNYPSGTLVPGVEQLPIPFPEQQEPPRIGVLRWPTLASRFATCHLLVTGDQFTSIRGAIGTTPAEHELDYFDGVTHLTANMWWAATHPISQRGKNELYMLTLVDDRWWWWQAGDQHTPDDPLPDTWGELIQALFTSVGVTPTIDTIPSEYGVPNKARWNVGYKPMPMLIDAACRTVGQRTVRQLDGSVRCWNYDNSKASDTAQWSLYKSLVLSGGQILVSDIAQSVPASVATVFLGTPAVTTTTTLASLALSDYAGADGAPGKVGQIIADMFASADGGDRTAYAEQATTDYYNWALSVTECTFRQFQPRLLTGLDDVQEWVHAPDQLVTRVLRPVWSDRNIYGDEGNLEEFEAYLTTGNGASPEKWKFIPITMISGVETLGTETTDFCAVAYSIDGINTCVPVKCLRVVMYPTEEIIDGKQQYAFNPIPRGMPVELTSGWGPGYDWKLLVLTNGVGFGPYSPTITGTNAYPSDNDSTLKSGRTGVLFPTPTTGGDCSTIPGWLFIPDDSDSAPGVGCGLTYDSLKNTYSFDYTEVAGDASETALIVIAPGGGSGSGCDTLGVDLDCFSTTTETLVNDTWIELTAAGKIRQTDTKTVYTNCFNSAGLLVGRTAGTPYSTFTEVDLCNSVTCCAAAALSVDVVETGDSGSGSGSGSGGCVFSWDSTVTGGTSPYTYLWDFGDGGSSTAADPTHTYIANGTYIVTLTVRDACGQQATWTGTAVCDHADPQFCDCYDITGPYTVTVNRAADRTWIGTSGSTFFTLTVSTDGVWALHVKYTPTGNCLWIIPSHTWDGSGCFNITSSSVSIVPPPGGCPTETITICCSTHCTGGSGSGGGGGDVSTTCCMDYLIPSALYLTWSGGTGDYSGLNGTTVSLVYAASGTDCLGNSYTGWAGSFAYAGRNYSILLTCTDGGWVLSGVNCDGFPCIGLGSIASYSCDPLIVLGSSFSYIGGGCFASGSVNFTVGETHP